MSFDVCDDCGALVPNWVPVVVVAGLFAIPLIIFILGRQGVLSQETRGVLRPVQWAFALIGSVTAVAMLGSGW